MRQRRILERQKNVNWRHMLILAHMSHTSRGSGDTDVNIMLSVNLRLGRSNVRIPDGQSHGAWISRTSPGINTFAEGSINVRLSAVFCETNYHSRLAPGVRLHWYPHDNESPQSLCVSCVKSKTGRKFRMPPLCDIWNLSTQFLLMVWKRNITDTSCQTSVHRLSWSRPGQSSGKILLSLGECDEYITRCIHVLWRHRGSLWARVITRLFLSSAYVGNQWPPFDQDIEKRRFVGILY
jgi:hypothetical protein